MWWVIGLFVIIFLLTAAIVFKGRRDLKLESPKLLADRIFRKPERTLIDIPLFLHSKTRLDGVQFLEETKRELELMGRPPARIQLLEALIPALHPDAALDDVRRFAKSFVSLPEKFQKALADDGKCLAAVRFLKTLNEAVGCLDRKEQLEGVWKALGDAYDWVGEAPLTSFSSKEGAVIHEWKQLFWLCFDVAVPAHVPKRARKSRRKNRLPRNKAVRQLQSGDGCSEYLRPFHRMALLVYGPLIEGD